MKRMLSLTLLLALFWSVVPKAVAAGYRDSGSASVPKMSQAEITQLLRQHPLTLPEEMFEAAPSCQAPYAPGRDKDSALEAAAGRLNALRQIAGLPAVTLDEELCQQAQYGAVLLAASDFSHTPSQPSDMDDGFYRQGREATSSSNIYAGQTLTGAIDGFMDDSDDSNIDRLGHRRWQLNPQMGKVGFGYAESDGRYGSYVAEKVFDKSAKTPNYDFISWPSSGNFPAELFGGHTAWSVTLNPERYQTPDWQAVTVTLTRQGDGKQWTLDKGDNGSGQAFFNVETSNYGVNNCIIFRPEGIEDYMGTYTVEIEGLRTRDGTPVDGFAYQVTFFGEEEGQGQTDGSQATPFTDVPANAYYAQAVEWAVHEGIAQGTGNGMFSPDQTCSTGEILTFLWRSAGSPEPGEGSAFPDVPEGQYYTKAALWARGKGLVAGTAFGAGAPCTRGDTVIYLWKMAGSPAAKEMAGFQDVKAGTELAQAVSWAVEEGVTQGTGKGMFSPDSICTRGQIATFLYRDMAQ